MVKLRKIIEDINTPIKVYRGINPKYGDNQLGRMSIGIKHKLVSALGPNYTDNQDVAKLYGSQIVSTKVLPKRILTLNRYDDVIRLYKQYESYLTAGLAKRIKNTTGEEQLYVINKAGRELRDILSVQYDAIKVPFYKGDENFIKSHGLIGSIYIVLN